MIWAPGSHGHPLLQHHLVPLFQLIRMRGGLCLKSLLLLGARRWRVTLRKEQGPQVALSHRAGPLAGIHRGLTLPSAQAVGGTSNLGRGQCPRSQAVV